MLEFVILPFTNIVTPGELVYNPLVIEVLDVNVTFAVIYSGLSITSSPPSILVEVTYSL